MTTKTLLTRCFRVHAAKKFITTPGTAYYGFVGNHLEYPGSDTLVTQPIDSVQRTCSQIYAEMIFGKLIGGDDASLMVKRHDWVADTVYAQYDDADPTLFDKNFFVVVDDGARKDVFKCLFNNNGAASTVKPDITSTSEDDEFYETADGYQWKYLFSIPQALFRQFATDKWIPILPNANVAAAAVDGAIDVVLVNSGGSNYDTVLSGQFISNTQIAVEGNEQVYLLDGTASANSGFYIGASITITSGNALGQLRIISDYIVSNNEKRIVLSEPFTIKPDISDTFEITPTIISRGDGSGFVARPIVNTSTSNTIYKVEVLDRGQGYTFIDLDVSGNTGGITNNASLRAIIPPPGGHGANVEEELIATGIGITLRFSNTEGGSIPINNDVRTVGVLRDPLWANVEFILANSTGTFRVDDTIFNFTTNRLVGTATFADNSNTVVGALTNFNGLRPDDYIFISNGTSTAIRKVVAIDSDNSLEVDGVFTYSMTSGAEIFKADIIATGTVTDLNTNSVFATDISGIPFANTLIAGYNSSAAATIESIAINGRTVPAGNPFNTFDQRWRYTVSTTSGEFIEDEKVFTSNVAIQNAFVHETNSSFVAVTNKYGDIGETLTGTQSGAIANVESFLIPDIVPNSGRVIYIENTEPFTRANNQSETFKIVLEF